MSCNAEALVWSNTVKNLPADALDTLLILAKQKTEAFVFLLLGLK